MSVIVVLSRVLFVLLCVHVVSSKEPSCTQFLFLEQLLEKVVRMEAHMESIQSQLDAVKQTSEDMRHQTTSSAISSKSNVAFFATMVTNRKTYSANEVVQFETVMTNIGHGYDSSTGVFSAAEGGTYFFAATILSDNDAEVWAYLRVNGVTKASLNAKGHGTRHGSGSNALLITLQPDDDVKVVNYGNGAKYYGETFTSFAGNLLF